MQNADSIIMTMQSEGGDNDSNRVPKGAPDHERTQLETKQPNISASQTTNSSDEDSSKAKTNSQNSTQTI